MKKAASFFILLVYGLFVSCDYEYVNPDTTFSLNFGDTASKDFLGQVVDENNNPIKNATITIGTSTVQTDTNGVFIINDASVYEKFAYIKASKAGFIDGSRALVPTNGINNVKIMLLSGTIAGTVASGTTSNVTLSNGTKVVFDGNFKTDTGATYSGSINVIMHHLDPSDPNVSDKMPGMLFAQNSNGEARVLETYGMINVELRGSAGQKLQITNTAQIEMPITTSQQVSAPATIPLWHFDQTVGYWKEEGSATKTGNKYIGTVSHFSWWNCDAQFPTITLTVNIVDTQGNAIPNVLIGLIRNDNFFPSIKITNGNGQVSGLVPANETLIMNIYDNYSNVISTINIGPFATNTVLPNIALNIITPTLIEGTLLKCDNTNITNGYVLLKHANRSFLYMVTNGDFRFQSLTSTDNNFTLEGFNYDDLQTTGEISYKFTNSNTKVGNIKACNSITEFISYKIDNEPLRYIIDDIDAGSHPTGGGGLFISGSVASTTQGIYIYGNTNIPGFYTTSQFSIQGDIFPRPINTLSFNLSNYGAVGEYMDLAFNGTYLESVTGVSHTVTGVVHAFRDN